MPAYILARNGKKYYFRKARPEHKLKKPAGWSWNVEIVEDWKKKRIDYIVVVADWESKYYYCDIETFLSKAILVDRGYGRQLALPDRYWRVISNLRELEENGNFVYA